MTAALRIQGVPYSSMAQVEDAVKGLAADLALLPEESDEYEPMSKHIGELLAALPDERAKGLLHLITNGEAGEPFDMSDEERDDLEAQVRNEDDERFADEAPVCPMCNGAGVLGAEPPQDPTAERCPACSGYGNVYTGSRVPGHEVRNCPTCAGSGYVAKQSEIPLPPPIARAAAAPAWPNAVWNPTTQAWDAPPDALPWEGARWNSIEGKYE